MPAVLSVSGALLVEHAVGQAALVGDDTEAFDGPAIAVDGSVGAAGVVGALFHFAGGGEQGGAQVVVVPAHGEDAGVDDRLFGHNHVDEATLFVPKQFVAVAARAHGDGQACVVVADGCIVRCAADRAANNFAELAVGQVGVVTA